MIEHYTIDFFSSFTMDSDKAGHSYKMLLSESIYKFLCAQSKSNAYAVYNMFFDIYRIPASDNKSFIDLLDLLKGYEENTAALSDDQRDHYIHSVNVFILGLCVYSQNKNFRNAVIDNHEAKHYKMQFSSHEEEFLFDWGISSLFHDIGYPIEIINNQIKKFIAYVAEDKQLEIGPYISYRDFKKLNRINVEKSFNLPILLQCEPLPESIHWECPTDLIIQCISRKLKLILNETKMMMDNFLKTMQENGFVDHGFYSAIIVIKWYGEALLTNYSKQELFFQQVVTAATAIFLHNAYKNVFCKPPFRCGPMTAIDYPLAYLLILCDELQEWNREAYGRSAKAKLVIDNSQVRIDDVSFSVHYITRKGILDENYLYRKKKICYSLLDIHSLFNTGISISATKLTEWYIDDIKNSTILPRLLAENIETLAKKIHERYNAMQLERYPNLPLEYPTWEALPETLKYSNARQAQSVAKKLSLISCYIGSYAEEKTEHDLTENEIETLAAFEHQFWIEERMETGWSFGEKKDILLKKTPYLVPYDELSEDIKDLDRDTIKNIKPLLASVGLMIYKKDESRCIVKKKTRELL